nr:transposase [uncultured Bradyrhizobium sp.]
MGRWPPATGALERVQALVRQRVLRLFERRGLLSREMVALMQGWGHSGRFSVHAGVRVAAQDSAGRERLLRYCARPMFAGERLVWAGGGAQVRYRLPWAALQGHRPEQQQQRSIELRLSASEFLDRVAALIPPPRKHRHRYFGVLAPNSPWRAQVVAQAGCLGVIRASLRAGLWLSFRDLRGEVRTDVRP